MTKLKSLGNGLVQFYCPGCEELHTICIEGPNAWGFDGNYEAPTVTPSVLVTSGHYVSTHKPGDNCWCDFESRTGRKSKFSCKRCHTFIKNGVIEFLSDCSHALANQTISLPNISDYED